jgi:hypothetical protein
MRKEEPKRKKSQYEAPRILASYTREELLQTIRPHGWGGGCGCGVSS